MIPGPTDSFLSKRILVFERRCVLRLMSKAGGNVAKAAKLAGRSRTQFYAVLHRHGLVKKKALQVEQGIEHRD